MKKLTKYDRINKHIEYLFGELGHKKGQFAYESWLNHHAVVEIVNDAGGCHTIYSTCTAAELLRALEAMGTYKNFLKR